jgi:head-tail adaptor
MSTVNLCRKLVLEAPVEVPDGAVGFLSSWSPLGILWADVRASSGTEAEGGQTTLSRLSYRIMVRATPFGASSRPKPDQRFREGNRIFRITAVAEYGTDGLYLTCFADEEVVA